MKTIKYQLNNCCHVGEFYGHGKDLIPKAEARTKAIRTVYDVPVISIPRPSNAEATLRVLPRCSSHWCTTVDSCRSLLFSLGTCRRRDSCVRRGHGGSGSWTRGTSFPKLSELPCTAGRRNCNEHNKEHTDLPRSSFNDGMLSLESGKNWRIIEYKACKPTESMGPRNKRCDPACCTVSPSSILYSNNCPHSYIPTKAALTRESRDI